MKYNLILKRNINIRLYRYTDLPLKQYFWSPGPTDAVCTNNTRYYNTPTKTRQNPNKQRKDNIYKIYSQSSISPI